MITIERSALVAHDAATLYSMVTDIESYPQFLPWCRAIRVHESRDDYVRATIEIDYRGVKQAFTTENINSRHDSVSMRLIDGPFKSLRGQWRFRNLKPGACKVELTMQYEFASPLLSRLVGPVFNHIGNTMVDAFIRRADELHRES